MAKPLVKPPPKETTSINLPKNQLRFLRKIKKRDKIPVSSILEQLINDRFEKELKTPKKYS